MSALTTARRVAGRERPLSGVELAVCGGGLVAATAIAAVAPEGAAARWFLAGVIAVVLGYVCLRSTVQGVLFTFLWLFALGMSRRVASEFLADPSHDPFLLVGVAAVTVLALRALLVGALRKLTPLSWTLLVFTVLVVLEMANPDNPSGFNRFAGLLVWVAPTLWFWVGRTLVDDRLARRLLYLVAGTATAIAVYGIAQAAIAFPPWDQRWINLRGFVALYIGPDTVRPFGTFASASEFALACAVGAVLAATAAFGPRLLILRTATNRRAAHRQRRVRLRVVVGAVLVFLVTSLALVLSAIRTYLVLLVIALPVVYLVMYGRRAWKYLIPALLLVALGFAALSQVDPDSLPKQGALAGFRRVVVAVNDPFVSNKQNTDNTLQLHWDAARNGFRLGFEQPLGRGTGVTGIPTDSPGEKSTSTDFDISDAGISFGVLGLALTIAIVLLGFFIVIRVALRRRTFVAVATVGVLVVTFGAWFRGAHYVMTGLLWLLLGVADAAIARGRDRDRGPTVDAGTSDDADTMTVEVVVA